MLENNHSMNCLNGISLMLVPREERGQWGFCWTWLFRRRFYGRGFSGRRFGGQCLCGLLLASSLLALSVSCDQSVLAQAPSRTDNATGAASNVIAATDTVGRGSPTGLDLLSLMISGGFFMIPIGVLSLFVVMFIVERAIGLRRGWLYPKRFRRSILQFTKQHEADPRIVYQSCQEHPSAAANILKGALVQVGRPLNEIKQSVQEMVQRGADRAFGNVRWLNFAAGVAPLLGLLGTVWGLIRAFHDTTQLTAEQLAAGQNRADFLAVGIYEALVTTLAGLVVAIPAAAASHYFEGKITRTFDQLEEDVLDLLPRFEGYEGVTRFDVIGREIAPRSPGNNSAALNATNFKPAQTKTRQTT